MKKPIMKVKDTIKIGEKVYSEFKKEFGRNPNWPAETMYLSEKAHRLARKKQGLKDID